MENSQLERIMVLVVAYNASSTLEETLERIPQDFRSRIGEIVVADDASDDDTFERGTAWRDRNPDTNTTVIRHLVNRGYGGNQKVGYQMAIERGFDVVVLLHADGQYAPEAITSLVDPIVDGTADAVFGSRMMEPGAARRGGMPMYKYVGNKILTKVENTVLGSDLSEFHSGYRAYSVKALAELPFRANSDGFDFDTQIIVQLLDADKRILEVPIPTYYGDEICYVNGMAYARDVVKAVLTYRTAKAGFGLSEWVPSAPDYSIKEEAGSSHSIILDLIRDLPAGKVLDVGCSSGEFSVKVRALGHHVTGVDIMEHPEVAGRVDEFHLADLDEGLPELGTGYDVIIAADVIEHVRNPKALLQQMTKLLAPNGRLIVSTPNFGHWYARARVVSGTFDYDRRGILDETHLRFFTRRGLYRILEESSLVVEEMRHSATFLPVIESGGKLSNALSAIDRRLVKARPTFFGYQFVMVLRPMNLESVTG
jgi:2-polyprenyl-3-methyl-5-hydroxy-6-metoxy-1,4-benzoquinol methylase